MTFQRAALTARGLRSEGEGAFDISIAEPVRGKAAKKAKSSPSKKAFFARKAFFAKKTRGRPS